MATVLLLMHEATPGAPDDSGEIGPFLESAGHVVRRRVLFPDGAGTLTDPGVPELPDLSGVDLVIVFGSAAHVWGEETRHWVEPEVAWVSEALLGGTGVLGICFGAQVLAAALGGEVVQAGSLEGGMIGMRTSPGAPFAQGPWFSWHQDVIRLPGDLESAHGPEGAPIEVLARNDFSLQAFRCGRALGVQFHPEATIGLVTPWIDEYGAGLGSVATLRAVRADLARNEPTARANCRALVEHALETLAQPPRAD